MNINDNQKNILKAVGSFLLYYFFLPVIISLASSRLLAKYLDNGQDFKVSIVLLVGKVLTAIIFLIIYRKDLILDFHNLKNNWKEKLSDSFRIWLIGLMAMMICNYIVTGLMGEIASNEAANRSMMDAYPLYAYIAIILLGPIVEELVFRNNFRHILKNKWSFVLITGITFGAAHVISPFKTLNLFELLYLLPYCSIGIAFSYMFYNSKNIIFNIIMHIFHNSVAVLMLILTSLL